MSVGCGRFFRIACFFFFNLQFSATDGANVVSVTKRVFIGLTVFFNFDFCPGFRSS